MVQQWTFDIICSKVLTKLVCFFNNVTIEALLILNSFYIFNNNIEEFSISSRFRNKSWDYFIGQTHQGQEIGASSKSSKTLNVLLSGAIAPKASSNRP